jgi:hypothetical protein
MEKDRSVTWGKLAKRLSRPNVPDYGIALVLVLEPTRQGKLITLHKRPRVEGGDNSTSN